MAKDIDWDFIKSEYEETPKSIRRIARENGVTHGAIQRNANKQSWERTDFEGLTKDKSITDKRNPILGKIGLRKMREVIDELGDNYSVLDEPLVLIYASNYEMWIEQFMIVREEGVTATSSKGSEYLSANFSALLPLQKSISTIASQLGLSIASRKRLRLEPKSDTEEASLFDIAKDMNDCDIDV